MYIHLNLKKAYNYRLILSKYQTLILKKKKKFPHNLKREI